MCSCFECANNLYITFVGRQDNDSRIREFSPNRDDGIEAIHLRHLEIHQRDVGSMLTELLHSLAPIRGFGDQSHIGLSTEE